MASSDKLSTTVAVTPDELFVLLNRMDASQKERNSNVRRSRRHRFRSKSVGIELLDRHGVTEHVFRVTTRNLSRHGLSFIHRQMMPTGYDLWIHIPLLDGRQAQIGGRVVRCRHLQGMYHEVGVEFI